MGINHVTLLVQDKHLSQEFYTHILGFEKRNIGNSLWITIGNQFIHLSENKDYEKETSFSHFAIEIDDLPDFGKKLLAKEQHLFLYDNADNIINITIDTLPDYPQYFLRDPDGNLLEFIDAGSSFFHPQ